jgi:CRP/FNR family transcriptional regulator, cyclic AMP receptor protein
MKKFKNQCILFNNLSDKEIKIVTDKLVLREFRSKEPILREGNENDNIFVINEGVVRVDTYSNNRRQTLSFLKEGDFFGEIAIFTNNKISANVISIIKSEIYTLRKNDLNNLISQIPQLAYNIIEYLANRVKSADNVIYDYAFKMLEARVASKLIILMHMFKGTEKNKPFINLPITHQDLADFVGTSRETVTKILAKFKEGELIDVQTKKIIILNEERLEAWGAD